MPRLACSQFDAALEGRFGRASVWPHKNVDGACAPETFFYIAVSRLLQRLICG